MCGCVSIQIVFYTKYLTVSYHQLRRWFRVLQQIQPNYRIFRNFTGLLTTSSKSVHLLLLRSSTTNHHFVSALWCARSPYACICMFVCAHVAMITYRWHLLEKSKICQPTFSSRPLYIFAGTIFHVDLSTLNCCCYCSIML